MYFVGSPVLKCLALTVALVHVMEKGTVQEVLPDMFQGPRCPERGIRVHPCGCFCNDYKVRC